MGDKLLEGTPSETLGRERWELVPMHEQQCELQCGVSGIVFRSAGGEGCTISRDRQRIDRQEHQKVIFAQGEDQRPFGEFEAESHGLAPQPCPQRRDPRVDGLGRVRKLEALPFCRASRLEAPSMFGLGPVEANKSSKGGGCSASCVISQSMLAWREGTCLLTFCAGIRGSRWHGRPCGFVSERQRTRGGEEMFVSLACSALDIRPPRVHVPAFPESYLPGVDSITESRTVYL
jgi:hypothetical protein